MKVTSFSFHPLVLRRTGAGPRESGSGPPDFDLEHRNLKGVQPDDHKPG